MSGYFPILARGFERVKEMRPEDWGAIKTYAEDNPLEGMLVGGLCFIASMGMDILISILRWGGLGLVVIFGYMLFQKKKTE